MSALDDLLSPLGAEAFFATVWEQQPAHLPGDPARGASLCSHARLLDALVCGDAPPEGLVAFPAHLDPALDLPALLADPALLATYLDEGHPLVWNRARGVFPEVDALAAVLAVSFGAQVWPNVYATGTAGTPFDAHFDAHEVIAVQCEGHKRWSISALRVDRPLDVTEMEPANAHALASRRDEALARPLLELIATPGSVVYVPRGQFHNAQALGGRSLHLTFGIRLPAGFDALRLLANEALADPGLREYLLPAALDPTGEAAAAEAEAIAERLRAQLTPARVGAALATIRARFRSTSR
ncbi:MAG: cupin domain-containing protein [Minicystis sp.]